MRQEGHRSALIDAGLLLAEAGNVEAAREALATGARESPPAYTALFALHEIEEGSAGAFRCGAALRELLERASRRGEENEFTALARCAEAIEAGDWDKAREAAAPRGLEGAPPRRGVHLPRGGRAPRARARGRAP